MRVKLVLFDALYTIVKPRSPIHIQYAQVFESYLGTVDPMRVKAAFTVGARISHLRPACPSRSISDTITNSMVASALKDVQRERPAYAASKDVSMRPGAAGWWAEVIQRTAVGAGSDPMSTPFYLIRVYLPQRSCLYRGGASPSRDHIQTVATIQFERRL